MVKFFRSLKLNIFRTVFLALSIIVTLNVNPSLAKKEMKAFSYMEKSASSSTRSQPVLSNVNANSAKVASQDGVESWRIILNGQLSGLGIGDELQLPLPSGEILKSTIKSRKELSGGGVQFRASLNYGDVVLTVGKSGVTYSSITSMVGSLNLTIGLNDKQEQVLMDQDTLPIGSIDFTGDMVETKDQPSGKPEELNQITSEPVTQAVIAEDSIDGKTNLDILFIHSPEFAQTFVDPQARIEQLIGFSNTAYDNSGILINMRAAAIVELDINNDDSALNLLNDAQRGVASEGFGSVADLRNQFGADLVTVLTSRNDNGANGVAFVGSNLASFGFSSTKLSTRCCDLIFTHEIGHNLGSGHQRQELNLNNISPCTGGFTGFSCGHALNNGNTNVWGTIMSSGASIMRNSLFSNLSLDCQGSPCGIAQGQPGAADNQTSFNQSILTISQFRDEVLPSPTSSEDDILFYVLPLLNAIRE